MNAGLDKNQFSIFPKNIFQLKKLEILSLGNNQLSSIPDALGKLKHLNLLSLGQNKFDKKQENAIRKKFPSIEYISFHSYSF